MTTPKRRWTHATAVIEGPYRYELTRQWDDSLPNLEWIMLNPSTATADEDDPTIRRCIDFAIRWDFGGIVVHNVFAYRATKPADLRNAPNGDPVGPVNRQYLQHETGRCGLITRTMAAWGASAAAGGQWTWQRGREFYCLGRTQSGAPKHPLYVKSSQLPEVWTP